MHPHWGAPVRDLWGTALDRFSVWDFAVGVRPAWVRHCVLGPVFRSMTRDLCGGAWRGMALGECQLRAVRLCAVSSSSSPNTVEPEGCHLQVFGVSCWGTDSVRARVVQGAVALLDLRSLTSLRQASCPAALSLRSQTCRVSPSSSMAPTSIARRNSSGKLWKRSSFGHLHR